MKLFISWAKDSAKAIALALHDWIPAVTLNQVNTWCSADPKCLQQGSGFPETILRAAKESDACVVIVTRESVSGWWTNFEAGLFFGQGKKVFAVLCGDVTHQTLGSWGHPLSVTGVNFTFITEDSLTSFLVSLKPDDQNWLSANFKPAVSARFNEIKSQYDEIFNESHIRLSTLLGGHPDNGM